MGKSVYFRWMFATYLGALVVCSTFRVYFKLFFTEQESGFYREQTPMIWVYHLILGAVILLLVLISRLKRVDNDYPIFREGRGIGLLTILTGILLGLYMLEDTGWYHFTPYMGMPLESFWVPLCGTLGILAALSFVLMGIWGFAGRGESTHGVVAIFPAIWQLVLLVGKFNSYTTLTTIEDNLLTVLFMVFSSCFIVGHARTICGYARKDGRNYTIPTGLVTSLLGLLLVLPNYLYMALNKAPMPALALGTMESIYVTCLSIYALAVAIQMRRSIALV